MINNSNPQTAKIQSNLENFNNSTPTSNIEQENLNNSSISQNTSLNSDSHHNFLENLPPHIKPEDLQLGRVADGYEVLEVLTGHLPPKETRLNTWRLNAKYLRLWDSHIQHGGIIFEGAELVVNGETVIDKSIQVKLFVPRKDFEKGTIIKYESQRRSKINPSVNPKGEGVFLPLFTEKISDAIEARLGVRFTSWEEVYNYSKPLQIIVAEGHKKAIAAMEAGYLAISVPGCYGAIRNEAPPLDGNWKPKIKRLVDGLKVFCGTPKEFVLAFDEDEKPETIAYVEKAAIATYFVLKNLKMEVSFLKWDHHQGKGLDDFIATQGKETLDEVFLNRLSLEEVRLSKYGDLSRIPKTEVSQRYLNPELIINSPGQIIFIKGNKGTGKSQAIKTALIALTNAPTNAPMQKRKIFFISHRRTLARELASDNNLIFINDVTNSKQQCQRGYSICWDSLFEINLEDFNGATLILDEIDQSFIHLLTADTQVAKNRVAILQTFTQIVQKVITTGGKIIGASADISLTDINLLTAFSGKGVPIELIVNHYNPIKEQNRKCYFYESESDLIDEALKTVKNLQEGQRVLFCTDSMEAKSKMSTQSLESLFRALFPEKKVLRIDSTTIVELIKRYGSLKALLTYGINEHDIILGSPVIETGISLDTPNQFFKVFGHFVHLSINSALQMLERYRGEGDRHVFFKEKGLNHSTFGNTVGSIMNYVERAKDKKSPLVHTLAYLKEADNMNQFVYGGDHARSYELAFAQIIAKQNTEAWIYRKRAQAKLKQEGYNLILVKKTSDPNNIKALLTNNRNVNYTLYRDKIASLPIQNDEEYTKLANKDEKIEAEINLETTNRIARIYKIVPETADGEIIDNSEDLKEAISVSEPVYSDLVAINDKKVHKKIKKLAITIKGLEAATYEDKEFLTHLDEHKKQEFSFDFLRKTKCEIAQLLEVLGVADYIKKWLAVLDLDSEDYPNMIADASYKWHLTHEPLSKNSSEIEAIAAKAREPRYKVALKRILGVTICSDPESPKGSPIAIFNQIIRTLGLTLGQLGKIGPRGNQQYIYSDFLEFNLPKIADFTGVNRDNLAIPYLLHTLKHLVGYYEVSQNMVSKSLTDSFVAKSFDINIEKSHHLATEEVPQEKLSPKATEEVPQEELSPKATEEVPQEKLSPKADINSPGEKPPLELNVRIASLLNKLQKGVKVAIHTAKGWLEGAVNLVGWAATSLSVDSRFDYCGADGNLLLNEDFLRQQPEYLDKIRILELDEDGDIPF